MAKGPSEWERWVAREREVRAEGVAEGKRQMVDGIIKRWAEDQPPVTRAQWDRFCAFLREEASR